MRMVIVALGMMLLCAAAQAKDLTPQEAGQHVGEAVTVEGIANVYAPASGKVKFVDLGGSGQSAPFSAVVFPENFGKFPTLASFNGKKVDIKGIVQMYQGKPEIVLTSADQLKLDN